MRRPASLQQPAASEAKRGSEFDSEPVAHTRTYSDLAFATVVLSS